MSFIYAVTPPAGPSATNGQGHIITTREELLAAWRRRDEQYAERVTALTPDEVEAIREQRMYEAGFIEPRLRGPVFRSAKHWRPPALGEWS